MTDPLTLARRLLVEEIKPGEVNERAILSGQWDTGELVKAKLVEAEKLLAMEEANGE